MNLTINKLNAFFKGLVILITPHIYLSWIRRPFQMIANIIAFSEWRSKQDRNGILDDFYSPTRNYDKRYKLYEYVSEQQNLPMQTIDYLEFGVCGAYSFKWWLNKLNNQQNRFYGFDTFEGLPEAWGTFDKGDMSASLPDINDDRVRFLKGLFQDTLPGFLREQVIRENSKKIIHLDADLFSSTLYALTSLAPYLKKGDILLFDEFNVPNHEFFAFKQFCESYYIKTKLIGAVNNYYQVAIEIL